MLDFLIGIERDTTGRIVDQPDRQPKAEGALLRFFELAPDQTTVQPVQFRFAHGAAESQEQAIIVLAGVIDPIFVDHQGVAQRTDLNEAIPVTAGASQAGRF